MTTVLSPSRQTPQLSKPPLVSVIMPAYNTAETLARAVRSVQSQTYSNWELIIVVDGSPDNSLEIAQQLAESDSRITVIWQANQGVSVARNTAMQNARGDYFAFLDSDDIWLPQKLVVEVQTMGQHGPEPCFVYSRFYSFDKQNRFVNKSPDYNNEGNILEPLIEQDSMILPSAFMIHRRIFEQTDGYPVDCRYHEDYIFSLTVSRYFRGYPTQQYLMLYQNSPSAKGRRQLQHFDQAVESYIYQHPRLKEVLGSLHFEQYLRRMRRKLFYSFIMHNNLSFARRFQSYLQPGDLIPNEKKYFLAQLSMIFNVNFMYYAKVTYQNFFRTFNQSWWQKLTHKSFQHS
jgi:glycosyltransferase involved in cell wall biosynthesis